ncbi:MAG: type II toxin-antitoxin system prevent-host-death family antitoxin [Acidimicrobiia bacterium]
MSKVGIRALKQNASAVVADAAAGEVVTITDRGRPVAQLVPVAVSRIEALIAAERARPALRRLADLPAPVRRGRSRRPLSKELEEMRSAER